jgi:hypothetical protein
LLFADDLIVCGSASNQDAQTISQVINHFCNLSPRSSSYSPREEQVCCLSLFN